MMVVERPFPNGVVHGLQDQFSRERRADSGSASAGDGARFHGGQRAASG